MGDYRWGVDGWWSRNDDRLQIYYNFDHSEVIWRPICDRPPRGHDSKQVLFLKSLTQKTISRHPWSKNWHFEILTSQRSWEVNLWPPRGLNKNLMLFLKSWHKNLYLDTNEAKIDTLEFLPLRGHRRSIFGLWDVIIKKLMLFEIFDLSKDMGGQFVASERS